MVTFLYKFFLPMKAIIESLVLLTFFFLTNVNIKILFLLLKISDKCNYRNSFFTCVCFFLYFQFPVQSLRDLTLLINVVLLRGQRELQIIPMINKLWTLDKLKDLKDVLWYLFDLQLLHGFHQQVVDQFILQQFNQEEH